VRTKKDKVYGNESIRLVLEDLLPVPKWNVATKRVLVEIIASDLEDRGLWWHAKRVRNLFHRWLKGQACTPEGGDLSERRERGGS
jgi:hypothetical protein